LVLVRPPSGPSRSRTAANWPRTSTSERGRVSKFAPRPGCFGHPRPLRDGGRLRRPADGAGVAGTVARSPSKVRTTGSPVVLVRPGRAAWPNGPRPDATPATGLEVGPEVYPESNDSLRTTAASGRYQGPMTSDIDGPPGFPNAGVPLPPERAFVVQLRAPAAGGDDRFVGRAEHSRPVPKRTSVPSGSWSTS
jgi:hypothetical protein